MLSNKKVLVTSALPYANGPIHLGHLVEYIQTDIWVRLHRLLGQDITYVCADDAHGTPIMLKAREKNISPENLIETVINEHKKDFHDFHIIFDHYSSTHSETNREECEKIFKKLKENGYIEKKNITQLYDKDSNIFLPDRYIKGTCPKCNAENQYGDSCESCGATYMSTDLINPISTISGTRPTKKETEHYFFTLKKFKDFLNKWISKNDLQDSIKNKLAEWLNDDLQDWDISRDSPYFGFKIPGEKEKFFYVWMDAPIGYIASYKEFSNSKKDKYDFWKDENGSIYHFIGKDISYFHCLFWPAILEGANLKTPDGIYCHGFLTIHGKKMSKSRGTYIKARDYLDHLDPEYLRYYFASRLSNNIEDIDLNFDDFAKKINSDVIGKVVNLYSRCSSFIEKINNNTLAKKLDDESLYKEFTKPCKEIIENYRDRKYSFAIRKIMELADTANQYINEKEPWKLDKKNSQTEIQEICTQGINYYRIIIMLLSPVLPILSKESLDLLNIENVDLRDISSPLLNKEIKNFTELKKRIEEHDIKKFSNINISGEDKMKEKINFDEFDKVDLRVGEITNAEDVEDADRLIKLTVDLGNLGIKNIFSGIKEHYSINDLIGKKVMVVVNLKEKKMRFGSSEGMVLAADSEDKISLIEIDTNISNGSKVK